MITQSQINDVVDRIVKNYDPEKIIMFGSLARGEQNENSDLDLLVIKKTDVPANKRGIEVWNYLLSSRYMFPIDILVFTPNEIEKDKNNSYTFIYDAMSSGKTVYEKK